MKGRVSGDDSAHAVLAHQGNGVSVVHYIAGEFGHFGQELFQYVGLSVSRNEQAETRRGKYGFQEHPSFGGRPRFMQHTGMRGYAQEFVNDRPGRIPRVRLAALCLQPAVACGMEWRIAVRGVNQYIGVYDQHAGDRSIHRVIERIAICDIDEFASPAEGR
jgi:hypothetical protein